MIQRPEFKERKYEKRTKKEKRKKGDEERNRNKAKLVLDNEALRYAPFELKERMKKKRKKKKQKRTTDCRHLNVYVLSLFFENVLLLFVQRNG